MSTLPAAVRPRILDSTPGERNRPFGSDFAPQSLTYLLYLPFVLVIFGAAIWLIPTDTMFVIGALIGSLVALYVLVDIVFREAPLRLTTIYGMTLLLGYNLGALNSWLTMERGSLTLAESFARDPAALGRAIAACMAASAVLFVVGQLFERPLFGREFRIRFGAATLPVVSLSTLLILVAYATGKVGYMGLKIDEAGHPSPVVSIVMWWFFPAFAYSVCAVMNTAGITRLAIGILTLIQGLALVPLGRRVFALSLILAMVALRLGKYRLRIPVYQRLLVGIVGVALVLTASVTFLYLRVAGFEHRGKGTVPIRARLEGAYELLDRRNPLEILQMLGTDASSRSFMIAFFSDLLDASQRSTPLLGKDLLYNIQLTVPSVISADKFGIAPYGEETMANIQWGFSYIDEANSLLTAGAADFGFIGVILYPVLLTLMLRAVLELVQHAMPTSMAAVVALAYIFQSLQAEDVPVGYFLQIRSTILVAIILYLLFRLPVFSIRTAD
jgi:hypothetical protein